MDSYGEELQWFLHRRRELNARYGREGDRDPLEPFSEACVAAALTATLDDDFGAGAPLDRGHWAKRYVAREYDGTPEDLYGPAVDEAARGRDNSAPRVDLAVPWAGLLAVAPRLADFVESRQRARAQWERGRTPPSRWLSAVESEDRQALWQLARVQVKARVEGRDPYALSRSAKDYFPQDGGPDPGPVDVFALVLLSPSDDHVVRRGLLLTANAARSVSAPPPDRVARNVRWAGLEELLAAKAPGGWADITTALRSVALARRV